MHRHRFVLTTALAAAAVLPSAPAAIAQRAAAGAPSAINIPFERLTLPNGLEVILAPDHTVPQVAVDVWYHVGSKNEQPGRTGFAHMFEHVMFTGSGHVPYGLHDKLTQGVGGQNNGSTTNDRTNYWEFVPSNYLEPNLWMEADRMGFLLDKLDQAKFVAQRDIVQNERRQRVDNVPYGRSFELINYAMLPATNPYSWPVVGYMTDLQHATVDDVKNFFRVYYAPSNATLTVVGDFEPKATKAMIRKYFGDIPRGPAITRPQVQPATLAAEKRITFEDRVQVPRLFIAYPAVGDDHDDVHALNVLAQILAGPRTARLTKALVYDKQIAASAVAFNNTGESFGAFTIRLDPRPGNTLSALEAATDTVLARLKADGPTADEMARAQAGLEFGFVSALESNLGKAEILADGLVFHNDAAYYKTQYRALKGVTAADVKRVANKYLGSGRVVLSIVPAGKPELASNAAQSTIVTVAPDGGHYIMGTK